MKSINAAAGQQGTVESAEAHGREQVTVSIEAHWLQGKESNDFGKSRHDYVLAELPDGAFLTSIGVEIRLGDRIIVRRAEMFVPPRIAELLESLGSEEEDEEGE